MASSAMAWRSVAAWVDLNLSNLHLYLYQVVDHPLVKGEHTSGGSQLSSHVADSAHACHWYLGPFVFVFY